MGKNTLVGSCVLIVCSLTLWSDAIRLPHATYRTEAASISAPAPPTAAGTRTGPAPRAPAPGSLTYLDFQNGFRDVTFGDPPTSDMVLQDDAGDAKYYRRPHDDLSLAGAQLQSIAYGYYQGRCKWLVLATKGRVHSRAMLEVVRQTYGPGDPGQGNPYLHQVAWFGSRVSGTYAENLGTSDAYLVLASVPMPLEEQADEPANAPPGHPVAHGQK
jgi:hypothetical protein